jgi:hypothetical protein
MTSLSNDRSTHISNNLDNIGLSTEIVAMRILSTVYTYNIKNTRKEHSSSQFITIPSGSIIEGIGLRYYPKHLTSDMDILFCFTDIVVHDREVGARPSRNKYHWVTRPARHAGYVYIYKTDDDTLRPTDVKVSADVHLLAADVPMFDIHRPAIQHLDAASDYVPCCQIQIWPNAARE